MVLAAAAAVQNLWRLRDLHVERIPTLHAVVVTQVFQYLADLAGAAERDRIFSVELGVVPVHFRQTEDLVGEKRWRLFRPDYPQLYRLRNVEPRICPVEPHRPTRVEKMPLVIQGDE